MKFLSLKKYSLPNIKSSYIFLFFFLIYTFLGLCISYQQPNKNNLFFYADCSSVFADLTNIYGNHVRIQVHPLFLLLCQPIVLCINGIINRPLMSVVIVEATCGALSNLLFYAILRDNKVNLYIRVAFSLIFGFSFSAMLFSTISETYIFSCLGLISFWYFLSISSKTTDPLSNKDLFILLFFGIINFGITITNYAFYLIGVIYILSKKYNFKKIALNFVRLNCINLLAVLGLCLYQKFVWKTAPYFLTIIYNYFFNNGEWKALHYINFSFSLQKASKWFIECFCYPLLSPSIGLLSTPKRLNIFFNEYSSIILISLFGFYILFVFCLLSWFRNTRGYGCKRDGDGYIFSLFLSYICNLAFHFIFNAKEAFLYSPHYLFLFLLVFALVASIKQVKFNSIYSLLLSIFILLEVINNFLRYFQTGSLALQTKNLSINFPKAIIGTLLCEIIMLFIILIINRNKQWRACLSYIYIYIYIYRFNHDYKLIYCF